MILLLIYLLSSAFADPLNDHHGVRKYELMNCSNQGIHMIDDDSYNINFIAFNISYNICLDHIPNFVSSQVYEMLGKNIKHLTGSVCDFPESAVNGYIDNDCFYGTIMTNNFILIIEIPAVIDNNNLSKVLIYRSIDTINPSFRIDTPIHLAKKRRNRPKLLSIVNLENKYCGITIDMHTSYISTYPSMSAAVSSAISAVNYVNVAISTSKIEESPPIILYVKYINIVKTLPISTDGEIVDMFQLLDNYNELLSQRNRESCISSLFIGIDGNGTVGISYTGNDYGHGICDKQTSGNVMTKAYDTILSDFIFQRSFVHEIGHQLGSEHDPDELCTEVSESCQGGISDNVCVGNDDIGPYIMFPYVFEFEDTPQRMFSECSIRYIKNFINVPIRRSCFEAAIPSFENITISEKCGNGILDPFEECDSGKNVDSCCTNDCHLTPGSQCSDYNGQCCKNCKFVAKGYKCDNNSEWAIPSCCNGKSLECPPPTGFKDYEIGLVDETGCKHT